MLMSLAVQLHWLCSKPGSFFFLRQVYLFLGSRSGPFTQVGILHHQRHLLRHLPQTEAQHAL